MRQSMKEPNEGDFAPHQISEGVVQECRKSPHTDRASETLKPLGAEASDAVCQAVQEQSGQKLTQQVGLRELRILSAQMVEVEQAFQPLEE